MDQWSAGKIQKFLSFTKQWHCDKNHTNLLPKSSIDFSTGFAYLL
jgi:hypothetical protein